MNPEFKGKGGLVVYRYVYISAATIPNILVDNDSFYVIGNGQVEVSFTERKTPLVGLDNYLSKKSIPVGSDTTAI